MSIDHVHALPPGTRFEEYRLDTVLGAGGFGITYRAYDANLDKVVAIKEYLPDFATRAETSTVVPKSSADVQDYQWGLERFLDEARTLARFDHPNLNKVHRFFEANGTAYMVLEYIQGETLAARLGREPFLSGEALQRLLEEVLSGLGVMHEAGYVHRDIKPGNLMLREEDGSAVVLDFGAARQAVGRRSQRLTTILTPGYAPMEQYDGKVDRVGAWTDIYALGMVAYRCISGLGDGGLPDAVARKLAQDDEDAGLAPAVQAGKGRYNAKLLEAIDWAIEVDEESRPQGVGAWRQALTGAGSRKGASRPAPKSATGPAETAATKRTGMSWSSMALVAVIIALLGASAWQGWRLYREMPDVGRDASSTTAESQAVGQAEPHTGAGSGGQTEDAPAGTQPDGAAETGATMPDAGREATVTGDAGVAESTRPAAQPQPAAQPPLEQDKVARLLAGAEADLAARRLTSPMGNNAWEKYQRVLNLSPANPEAVAGMERVIGSYRELFEAALEQEEFDKAEGYMERIRELHPDSPALEEGAQRLQSAKREQAEREAAQAARLAEQERQRQVEKAARQAELERQAEEKARALVGEMVPIPGGGFQMGDMSGKGWEGEKPVHSVTVPAFRLGKHEVTFAQWDACVADGGCQHKPEDQGWGRGNRPVINVSWDDVQSFIGWLNVKTGGNYRLPSEAEWEYAARAGSTTNYSWGNAVGGNRANCAQAQKYSSHSICGDSYEHTAPVGSFPANAWGLHDMHGNVWEWTRDCWNDSYAGAPIDGSAWTRGDCGMRMFRGGSWADIAKLLRSASRGGRLRATRGSTRGFRVAQDHRTE